MVGATLQHLKALRRMRGDGGWIHILMDEAENERMHLMTFIEIANLLERWLILIAQGVFYNSFFLLYLVSSRTAHRMVGYFEEEAIISYTDYLAEIESGRIENVAAPQIAIDYWKLAPDARLKDVVIAVRADEAGHRDVNHGFADEINPFSERLGDIYRRSFEATTGQSNFSVVHRFGATRLKRCGRGTLTRTGCLRGDF